MMQCKVCGDFKDLSEFYKNPTYKSGYSNKCKSCHNEQTLSHHFANREKRLVQMSEYQKDNYDDKRNRDYIRKYGITLELYNEIKEEQDNCCKICGTNESKVSKSRLFVDHCHTTGKVRGLLCHNCNSMLGLAKDNISILLDAAKYLEENG
jgi:hypothetical protein